MSKSVFAVYGVSGCGRGIIPLAREQLYQKNISSERLVFIDDNPGDSIVNGQRVLTYPEFIEIKASERYVAIAVADGSGRNLKSIFHPVPFSSYRSIKSIKRLIIFT